MDCGDRLDCVEGVAPGQGSLETWVSRFTRFTQHSVKIPAPGGELLVFEDELFEMGGDDVGHEA